MLVSPGADAAPPDGNASCGREMGPAPTDGGALISCARNREPISVLIASTRAILR